MSIDKQSLRQELLEEIEALGIQIDRKLRLMELMDHVLGHHLGVFFLSDEKRSKRIFSTALSRLPGFVLKAQNGSHDVTLTDLPQQFTLAYHRKPSEF